MLFNPSDLNHDKYDYQDTVVPGDVPGHHKVDNPFLHRSESYEMAGFISKIMKAAKTENKKIGSLVEEKIQTFKPGEKLKKDDIYKALVRFATRMEAVFIKKV